MADQGQGSKRQYNDAEIRELIRAEIDSALDGPDGVRKKQRDIDKKFTQWETGAIVFRFFLIGTAAVVTAAAELVDWFKEHMK